MEDSSLFGDLERRPTEELNALLAYCLEETNYIECQHIVIEILRVLNERFVPDVTSEQAQRVRQMLLRYEPKD